MQSLAESYVQCPPSPSPPTLSPPSYSPFGSPPNPSHMDLASPSSPELVPPPEVVVVVADIDEWSVKVRHLFRECLSISHASRNEFG